MSAPSGPPTPLHELPRLPSIWEIAEAAAPTERARSMLLGADTASRTLRLIAMIPPGGSAEPWLRAAMQSPAEGQPARPAAVHVTDPALLDVLRPALDEAQVPGAVVAQLPALEDAMSRLYARPARGA